MQNLEFSTMPLSAPMLQSLNQMGYTKPTTIQSEVISYLMKDEAPLDMVALAQTGSGKTAAFGVPLLEKLDGSVNKVQALVLAPTRELAAQIEEILGKLMKPLGLRSMTIYGGQSYNLQRDNIKRKPHVLIATPGRLVDLLNQKLLDLTQLKVLVLDEADRMLSMGFEEDLQTILSFTHENDGDHDRASCQTWLFSATMAPGIKRILNRYLENPKIIEQVSDNRGVSATLKHHFIAIRSGFRAQALLRLVKSSEDFYGIVFCQTKREVSEVEDMLRSHNISCMSLHGDKEQRERESILKALKAEKFNILIATDVAARGIDVKNLTHVVHYSLPIEIESYVHRSGRTGRNGQEGLVISLIEPSDFSKLNRLQRLTGVNPTPYEMKKTDDILKSLVKKELDSLSNQKADSHIMQELKKICGDMLVEQETSLYSTAEWLAAVINSKMKDKDMFREDIYITDFSAKGKGGGGSRGGSRDFRPRRDGGGRSGDRRDDRRGDYRDDRRGPRSEGGYRAEGGSSRGGFRKEGRGDSGGFARGTKSSERGGERSESRDGSRPPKKKFFSKKSY